MTPESPLATPRLTSALVLELESTRPCTAPASLAVAAHAWMLDVLERKDPAVATALHAPHGMRPFTVSNITWSHALPGADLHQRTPLPMRVIALIRKPKVIDRILKHLRRRGRDARAGPWATGPPLDTAGTPAA